MALGADGQYLHRRPKVKTVGLGHHLGRAQKGPSGQACHRRSPSSCRRVSRRREATVGQGATALLV
jgi:hypothetical protein